MSKFKAGDKVYCPLQGTKIYVVNHEVDSPDILYLTIRHFKFNQQGIRHEFSDKIPYVFHATLDNQKHLEALYGITFETLKDERQELVDKLIVHFEKGGGMVVVLARDGFHYTLVNYYYSSEYFVTNENTSIHSHDIISIAQPITSIKQLLT